MLFDAQFNYAYPLLINVLCIDNILSLKKRIKVHTKFLCLVLSLSRSVVFNFRLPIKLRVRDIVQAWFIMLVIQSVHLDFFHIKQRVHYYKIK
jgi:hypothetical protein